VKFAPDRPYSDPEKARRVTRYPQASRNDAELMDRREIATPSCALSTPSLRISAPEIPLASMVKGVLTSLYT
jgi:hypothetical protein